MKDTKFNILIAGLAGSLCLSLLSACSDGRGSGSFRAYRYTPEERAAFLAKNARPPQNGDGQPAPDQTATLNCDENSPTYDPVKAEECENKNAGTGGDKASSPSEEPAGPVVPPVNTGDESQKPATPITDPEEVAQVYGEAGLEAPKNPVYIEEELLQTTIDQPAPEKTMNQTATDLVRAISFTMDEQAGAHYMTVDMIVVVAGKEHTLHVEKQKVLTNDPTKQKEKIVSWKMELKDIASGQIVEAGTNVAILGFHSKDKATQQPVILLLVQFLGATGTVDAEFQIEPNGSGWAIMQHNLVTTPPSFEEATHQSTPTPSAPATPAEQVPAQTANDVIQKAYADQSRRQDVIKPAATQSQEPAKAQPTPEQKQTIDMGVAFNDPSRKQDLVKPKQTETQTATQKAYSGAGEQSRRAEGANAKLKSAYSDKAREQRAQDTVNAAYDAQWRWWNPFTW
ncbi:MAG TPA: hypothetical protein PKC28_08345 [Bdellovibrionales bacterium]|nr:hypothetical protein [Bdellovibrionales bacterium]